MNRYNITTFFTYFIITLAISVSGIVVANSALAEIKETQIFGETETNLMEDMPILVDEGSIFFDAFQSKNRINVLVLGINDNMADTIMVLSFDYDAKHLDIISVPRDTYYYRTGYDRTPAALKINSIYQKTKNPLETAVAVSEVLLGMPLHFYAIMDYDGIEEIVDTIGGVPMDIPFHMKYTDPTDKPPLYIDIPAGQQVLDGRKSVEFLRFRQGNRGYSGYIDGDLGRINAQQEFMKSAFRQAMGFDLLKIAKVVLRNIESDIDFATAAKIATKSIGIKGNAIEGYTIPHTLHDGPPYYVYPDSEDIAEVLLEIYSIEAEVEEDKE